MSISPTFTTTPAAPLNASGTNTGRPTVNGGKTTGNTFVGRGNDFLDPDNIQDRTDDFSGSIDPVKSNTLTSRIIRDDDPTGKNPDAEDILDATNDNLNDILNGNFNTSVSVPVFTNFALPVPDLGDNPDPTKITLYTNFFANAVKATTPQDNASSQQQQNLNPLMWQNPDALSLLLGPLGSGSTVLRGGSLTFPAFNPFPSPSDVAFTFNPFGGGNAASFANSASMSGLASFLNGNMGNSAGNGVSLFPFTQQNASALSGNLTGMFGFSNGSALTSRIQGGMNLNPFTGASNANIDTTSPNALLVSSLTTIQPVTLSGSANLQDYNAQLSLLEYLNNATSILSQQFRQLVSYTEQATAAT